MGHIERKKRDKENIKNSILKAALDIAIAEGWQTVTIHRISEAIELPLLFMNISKTKKHY